MLQRAPKTPQREILNKLCLFGWINYMENIIKWIINPLRLYCMVAAVAAFKLLQSCPTLCSPIDGSLPGSPVPGILQARTLEWVAISFSNAWKWKVKVKSLGRVWLCATPWTAAYHAPPPMEFSRQEYWSGLLFSSPIYCMVNISSVLTSNGTQLQYSCLENLVDGGAWWAAVHGVAKSQTRLSDFTFTFHSNHYYSFSFSCLGLVCSFLFPSALKVKLLILDLYSFLIQTFYNYEFPSKYYFSCISMFGMLHLHFHSSQTSLNLPCDFFFDSLFTSECWLIFTCLWVFQTSFCDWFPI